MNAVAIASVHLPQSVFSSSAAWQSVDNSSCKLQFIAFRNGKLFPNTANSSHLAGYGNQRVIGTPVVFIKIDECNIGNLTSPLIITLKHFTQGINPIAVFWDFDLLDGHGGWWGEGCHIISSADSITTLHSTHFGNFAVLMDQKTVWPLSQYPGEFLHPVVYACTAVMLLCLFASIITYIVHHGTIRISRKGWHMLLNFCFHTALTFAVFAGGINRVKYPVICQAVGIVLHYSTLSTMLWIGVTARNIYKQVTKKPETSQNSDQPSYPKQPLLRFYLISGGVPFIICGITAATNINNYGIKSYAGAQFCWMSWEPSLGAFYGPLAFIILVTCIYFLCTYVQLRRHPERKYELKERIEDQQRNTYSVQVNVRPKVNVNGESQAHASCLQDSPCPADIELQEKGSMLTTFLQVLMAVYTVHIQTVHTVHMTVTRATGGHVVQKTAPIQPSLSLKVVMQVL
ncbi:adhesion G protein-coupled receptor A1 [Crotalus adamanteus]|uniref:Adhesion G protein-coupled receptor A1 n=1 Tax=Crotalus adamanteus TaxID=8729 RepID=A0AAW1BG48_CROAD